MQTATGNRVLAEAFGPSEGVALALKQAALVVLGVLALTIAAQIKVAIPPSPVHVNMGTFAVLTIAVAYGPRLGLTTILAYMLIGALGFDVFQSSTAEFSGIEYMSGSTGGYLFGYVLAVLVLGLLARRGWDRSVVWMAVAMLIGNLILYVPGLAWLAYWIVGSGNLDVGTYSSLTAQTFAWGATPFIIGDLMKLALAAMLVPGLWRLIGKARA